MERAVVLAFTTAIGMGCVGTLWTYFVSKAFRITGELALLRTIALAALCCAEIWISGVNWSRFVRRRRLVHPGWPVALFIAIMAVTF